MPNYKRMYFSLHNEVIRTINRLKQELKDAEELYESEDPVDLPEPEKPE